MEEYVRSIADENKPTNYPELADKLTTLTKDDYLQARELAGSLDEPLNIELSQDEFQKIDMPLKHRYDTERFQFIQQSTITGGMYEGMITIFFDKKENGWKVEQHRGKLPDGPFRYVPAQSLFYPSFSEAKQFYNAFADNPYVESDPLKKRGEGFSL